MAKLYPPQLEGALPAFYNTYDEENIIIGTTIKIPFGINRAVSVNSIKNIAIKIRTTSTNNYLVSGAQATSYDAENGVAVFKFNYQTEEKRLFNESQYYRVQIAFIDVNDVVGYYSTVGIIKCVAKPSAIIDGYDASGINMFDNTFFGVYIQDTQFGDSTEKAYSYLFTINNEIGEILATSGEKIHDATQDINSDSSQDTWKTYTTFNSNEIYYLQYIVTTLNGLVVSSPKYKIMKVMSIPTEFKIQIHADNNYDNGYIDVTLQGELEEKEELTDIKYQQVNPIADYDDELQYYVKDDKTDLFNEFNGDQNLWQQLLDEKLIYLRIKTVYQGERAYSGSFVITRSSSQTNFFEWVEITRFTLTSQLPSTIHVRDQTVEQGIEYKYALQQYNIHDMYSAKTYQTDRHGKFNTTIADFEDIFLADGERQLKIRFNPKITKFKTTIPEKKVETIGSQYPFIFRNGSVSYKEFPISGLISYQMDEAKLFLTPEELKEAGILEYDIARGVSNIDDNILNKPYGHEVNFDLKEVKTPVYDPLTHKELYTEITYAMVRRNSKNNIIWHNSKKNNNTYIEQENKLTKEPNSVRMNKDFTSENILGERYFKLKVLDWLNNGKIKLFRSSTEGNYLVRLLNIQMQPQDKLGRMIHSFSCTAYEIAELTYDNLIEYGIVVPKEITHFNEQWGSINVKEMLNNVNKILPTEDGFIKVSPDGISIKNIYINNFATEDQIKIVYDEDGENIFSIGLTGSLELNADDRKIIEIWVKVNPLVLPYNDFDREIFYSFESISLTKFDAISNIKILTRTAEQFIGPKENILEPFDLRKNIYGQPNDDGVIVNPYSIEEGYNNVYNDLKNRKHLNYNIQTLSNTSAEKFSVVKIDILHVWKRKVIPIFAYNDNLTNFGFTPFYQGYVNSKNILNFLDQTNEQIKYSQGTVTSEDENGVWSEISTVDNEDIHTLILSAGLDVDVSLIFQVFIYNGTSWIPSNILGHKYFDNYTKTWWDGDTEYNPSFSINPLEDFTSDSNSNDIIGDNNIYLNETEEITLYNLGEISQIILGNGVIAEVTPQMRVVDYDIEISNNEVRQAKNAYLIAKDEYTKGVSTIDIGDAIAKQGEAKILQQKIEAIQKQLDSSEDISSYTIVQNIAQQRLIAQKKLLWAERQKKIKEIIEFLLKYKLYESLDGTKAIAALKDYSYTSLEENKQYNEEIMNKIIAILDQNITADSVFSSYTQGGLKITALPSSYKQISGIKYDFIEKSQYIDVEYYTEEKDISNNLITEYNNQINNLKVQKGNLIGGVLEDYSDEQLPPEGTRVYYEYMIKQLENQKMKELNKINQKKAKLLNKLIILTTNQTSTILSNINNSTATYLQNNAKALKEYLNIYLQERTDKLNALESTYNQKITSLNSLTTDDKQSRIDGVNSIYNFYKALLEQQISSLTDQIKILQDIEYYDGNEGQKFIVDEVSISNDILTTFNNKIESIRDTYITAAERQLTSWINNNTDLFDNLNFILNDIDKNDKVNSILNLFTTDANKTQSEYISNFLQEYYPAKDNIANSIESIINQIRDLDSLYISKTDDINTNIKLYNTLIEESKKEEKNIDQVIASLEIKFNEQNNRYILADEQLAKAEKFHEILDSKEFFDILVKNEDLQANITTLNNYLLWLSLNQQKLLNEAGHITNDITSGYDYSNLIKNYIDAYEEEAFQFLHKYDSIINDLQRGFDSPEDDVSVSPGIDRYAYNLNSYYLTVYKDILFILNNTFLKVEQTAVYNNQLQYYIKDSNKQDSFIKFTGDQNLWRQQVNEELIYIRIDDNIISDFELRLTSANLDTRINAYHDLQQYLYQLFRGTTANGAISIKLGVILNNNIATLIEIKDEDTGYSGSTHYPTIKTFGPNSSIIAQLRNGIYNYPTGLICEDDSQEIIDVIKNGNGEYEKNPYNLSQIYYVKQGFDLHNMSQATFINASNWSNNQFNDFMQNNSDNYVWVTAGLPLSLTLDLHPFIYNTDNVHLSISKFEDNLEENILLTPLQYQMWYKDYLGLIIHDYDNNNKEHNSFYKLSELDIEIFKLVGQYFHYIIQYNNLPKNNSKIKELYTHSNKLSEYEIERDKYADIIANCTVVLEEYEVQDDNNNEVQQKKEQLSILLQTAKQSFDDCIELIRIEELIVNELKEDPIIKELYIVKEAIRQSNEKIKRKQNEFNLNFIEYNKKINHYLSLLFNEIPYGTIIDQSILVNKDLVNINNINSNSYNLGLAYAIENYKKYRGEFSDNINFTDAIQKASDYEKYLNIDFPLITQINFPATYNENYIYYKKDVDKYIKYLYLDNKTWNDDVQNNKIYISNYPSLCDFINYIDYYKLNNYIEYDENEVYYVTDGEKYYIYQVSDINDFINMRENLYVKGNGGLNQFLHYLSGDMDNNKYMEDVKNAYEGTIELIKSLLNQVRGNTMSKSELQSMKRKYIKDLDEILELLDKYNNMSSNAYQLTDNVYKTLAEFLRVLTVTYIEQIERNYGVV